MASDKAAMECDVGLGLKMQRNESFPCKKMMGMPHLPYHQSRVSSPSESCGGGFGGGGPIFCNASNQVAYMSDISDVVGAGAGAGAALPRTLHHFNTDTTFKCSGRVTTSLRVPFTAAQWQELERQTTICKYMMASVPVPPELLMPINKTLLDDVAASQSNLVKGSLGLGYSNGSDPEPWRCRRTDGKKWRCSRDVTPDQKYCERHAHKNRPRSRKPVEVHAQFTNNNNKKTHSLNLPAETTKPYHQKSHFLNQTNHQISPLHTVVSATSYDQARCSEYCFLKGETAPVASPNQQWQQLMQSKLGMNKDSTNCYKNACVFQQQQEEPMNSNLGTDLGNGPGLQNDQCNLFLGPKLASLEGALNLDRAERPRDFIDAWSTAERDSIDEISHKWSASSNGKLPLSSLTLSMCGGNGTNEEKELEHAQMGLGIMDSERENGGGVKSQPLLNWMSPGSWMGSPPGGPLAEALCLGIPSTGKAASNAASPHGRSSSSTTSSSSKSSSGDTAKGSI